MGQFGKLLELDPQPLDHHCQLLKNRFVTKDSEGFKGNCCCQRIAAKGVAVIEGPAITVTAQEGLPDGVGCKGGGHRQVACGEPLAEAKNVRADILLFAGKHRAGAAEADSNFVEDQQHAMAVGELANRPQETGRVYQDAAGRLHQWLHDDCGDVIPLLRQQLLQPVEGLCGGCCQAARVSSRTAVSSGRGPGGQAGGWQPDGLKRQRRKHRGKPIDAANANGAQRVAVVSLAEGDVAGAWLLPPCPSLQMVLKGDFEGGLGGR